MGMAVGGIAVRAGRRAVGRWAFLTAGLSGGDFRFGVAAEAVLRILRGRAWGSVLPNPSYSITIANAVPGFALAAPDLSGIGSAVLVVVDIARTTSSSRPADDSSPTAAAAPRFSNDPFHPLAMPAISFLIMDFLTFFVIYQLII